MIRVLAIAVVSLVLTLPVARGAEPLVMPLHETPRPVRELRFIDRDGQPITDAAWHGKVVLLNLWATWCIPCREEMPTLDRLQARLGGDDFEVVALSIDRAGPRAVAAFYDEYGIEHLGIFVDPSGRVARDLEAYGLPATLLIGPDGLELGRLVGPAEWDTDEMVASLEAVLSGRKRDK